MQKILDKRTKQFVLSVARCIAKRSVDAKNATGIGSATERYQGAAERSVVKCATELCLRAAVCRLKLGVAQLCAHNASESTEVILADEVGRPVADGRGSCLLAHHSRHNDQRYVGSARAEQPHRRTRVKVEQYVIAQYDIPMVLAQSQSHPIAIVHAAHAHVVAGALERSDSSSASPSRSSTSSTARS